MRTIASSVSNRNAASAFVSSVLPTPVGPRNRNEPFGRFGSDEPARARRIAFATVVSASSLADDALLEEVLHVEQLVLLALEHLRHRNAGPLRDDLGDFLVGDLVAHELDARSRSLRCACGQAPLELGNLAVLQLGHAA